MIYLSKLLHWWNAKKKKGFSYIEKRENDKTVVKTSSLKDVDTEWMQYIMYK